MKHYTIRKTGIELTGEYLDDLEEGGMSEQSIANHVGVSRQMLHRIRVKIGCKQKVRSDKGSIRDKRST